MKTAKYYLAAPIQYTNYHSIFGKYSAINTRLRKTNYSKTFHLYAVNNSDYSGIKNELSCISCCITCYLQIVIIKCFDCATQHNTKKRISTEPDGDTN